jgi:hypothetical protein
VIRRALRLLIGGVLAWQAVAGSIALGHNIVAGASTSYRERLLATTDERLAAAFGDDFAIARALRECAAAGEWALSRVVPAESTSPDGVRRGSLLTRLRNALYPRPYLPPGTPDPVALAERGLRPGQSVLLLVLGGDAAPDGRPGWSCLRREAGVQVWRFQKA